jgi:sulfonate transport system ATP-binding protein
MLTLTNVGKSYPSGVRALDGVSLAIAAGEVVVIVGGSGCGKSTLLRIVCGLERPSEGRVALGGTPVAGPREEIGMVFQEPRLLPWLSVADNVGFGLPHLSGAERARSVSHQLARVGLADKAAAWPRELSGGEGQRVALARALIMCPQVLLLDEPFSALDAFTRADLQDHLLDLWADGRPTLVVVTHDVEEAVVLADRIVVMGRRPGHFLAEIAPALPRPRDRRSPAFDDVKGRVLTALERSRRPVVSAA